MGRSSMKELSDIPLTPLIDTALTLLIIFMVTAPMINNAIKVTLPKGKTKETSVEHKDLVVYIDDQKQLFFDNKKYDKRDMLIEAVKTRAAQKKDTVVVVKAGEKIAYGQVIELVDQLKNIGGLQYVVLAMQKAA